MRIRPLPHPDRAEITGLPKARGLAGPRRLLGTRAGCVCACPRPARTRAPRLGPVGDGEARLLQPRLFLVQSPILEAGEVPCRPMAIRTHVRTHRTHLALRHCVGTVAPLS